MVNLGSDACCPGAPAAAAGGFMIGTWGTNTDWVGRFVPITWKYIPSWSTNVLGFHNTGFMSWTWSWFTRWGPSWSTGGNASPRVRRNPRLSSSPGAVATPWWPIQDPRDLPSPGGRVLAEPASSRWQMTPTLPGLSLGYPPGVVWDEGEVAKPTTRHPHNCVQDWTLKIPWGNHHIQWSHRPRGLSHHSQGECQPLGTSPDHV